MRAFLHCAHRHRESRAVSDYDTPIDFAVALTPRGETTVSKIPLTKQRINGAGRRWQDRDEAGERVAPQPADELDRAHLEALVSGERGQSGVRAYY